MDDNISVFTGKIVKPTDNDLIEKLDSSYKLWERIYNFVLSKYPSGLTEWNFSSKGWSFRIKDKKRAIIYLLPRDRYFKVAFVFGDKAVAKIMESPISNDLKTEIEQARKYVEGRGVRIDVKDDSVIFDIEQLVDIKLDN